MGNTDEGLLFEGKLAFTLSKLDAFPDDSEFASINASNESFLKSSMILHETTDYDEHDELSQELKRQDLKINLLIELMGELLNQSKKIPSPIAINLTTSRLIFSKDKDSSYKKLFEEQNIEPSSKVKVSLYITSFTPKPLLLFGTLKELSSTDISIEFTGLNQTLKEGLEKYIFRHHRRTIAQTASKKR